MASKADTPITSVPDSYDYPVSFQQEESEFPSVIRIDLRGTLIQVERELLVSLPESILLVMFPYGLNLGRNPMDDDSELELDNHSTNYDHDHDNLVYSDFNPNIFQYVLDFYVHKHPLTQTNPNEDGTLQALLGGNHLNNPFLNKQAFILLREEIDYFPVPKKTRASPQREEDGIELTTVESPLDISKIKTECGKLLVQQKSIFHGLNRQITQDNLAEQQLIEMLCAAGFSKDDDWGVRVAEPARTAIVSVAMVRLRTTGQPAQMAAAQKLLLFWRKPARKCWWDGSEVKLHEGSDDTLKLWCRRTWTLELALV
ncbi:hypothetical protein K493DRAFT_324083 [Basidiobolus meristosporus CBS 931.73]|uniref:Phosphatase activator n=1 Tax=Basidiobolus meristosporus CBS 931.73 TaxID=1314790 RepID=A0A1Y1YKL8_9FUNG|nr:hypothetical protein K493DRAFT_324083 [Basidiobolus meristosporus CBS 931.73]|eukprot:ORX98567.1 hypothetical protein K493DRAFT_324083 [Basidiobolus meristosporus CBS 931.73]